MKISEIERSGVSLPVWGCNMGKGPMRNFQDLAGFITNTISSPGSEAKLVIKEGKVSTKLSSEKDGKQIELIPNASDNVEIHVGDTLKGTVARTEILKEITERLEERKPEISGKIENLFRKNENLLVMMIKLMILLQK